MLTDCTLTFRQDRSSYSLQSFIFTRCHITKRRIYPPDWSNSCRFWSFADSDHLQILIIYIYPPPIYQYTNLVIRSNKLSHVVVLYNNRTVMYYWRTLLYITSTNLVIRSNEFSQLLAIQVHRINWENGIWSHQLKWMGDTGCGRGWGSTFLNNHRN